MKIQVTGLTKRYRDRSREVLALSDLHLTVEPGEFIAVVGRSGSGKTTLLNILGGLDRDYSGLVMLDERDLCGLRDCDLSAIRNHGIGFVFQAFHLLAHLSVLENVTLPALFGGGIERSEVQRRALDAIKRVGLADRIEARPTRLSAGERQRVAIARAILNRPRLLLCDEPTGNLDATTGDQVIEIFRELNEADRTTLVVATHSERVATAATRRVLLEAGRLVSHGGGA